MRMNRRSFFGGVIISAGAAGAAGLRASGRLAHPASAARAAKSSLGSFASRKAAVRVASLPTVDDLVPSLDSVRVLAVHPVTGGALPIVLEHMDQKVQVDVFRRDPAGVPGVVEVGELSLFIHNEGDGSVDTGHVREIAARALGGALAAYQVRSPLGSSLMTFAERERNFSGHAFNVEHGRVPVNGYI